MHRYSKSHVTVELTVAGRGLDLSRTPDGTWWRVRLRARRCSNTVGWEAPEPPPGIGVREPRRPFGPEPLSAAGEVNLL
jgi:hypothetical protein